MDGPDVPPFFICPISLQIMKDPVTISTGMTYDRDSIQKWILTYNNKSCPVTKQPLTDQNLTPNSTLLRLIESWSIINNNNNNRAKSSKKIDDPPSKPASDFSFLLQKIIEDHDHQVSTDEPNSQINFLRKIKVLVQENDNNGVYIQETHVMSLVVNLITKSTDDELERKSTLKDLCYDCSSGDVGQSTPRTIPLTPYMGFTGGGSTQHTLDSCSHAGPHNEKFKIVEEAMTVLYLIKPSTETLKKISEDKNGLLIKSLSLIIQHGSYQARIEAALLLKSIFKVVDDNYKADLQIDLFEGITEILKDQNSSQATKVVLSILIQVLQFPKNGIKAVKVGVVWVLVELLAESREKRNIEIMLSVLEQLCRTAEGRSAFLAHPASVAAVSSKILMVSQIANEKAVKILVLICRFCKNSWVVQELMEMGCVAKLFMVVQAECSLKTKEKAKEIIGFHIKAWNKSPCFSTCFIV
ncbi:U box domain [Macleaya cordata]|uniref:U-box domain-containing protein n=1 Tax=Macleaya cordata TaxID=56857 RepID=A0A200Q782_MACCD|nr:U box domain [Macleaya cordata]